MNSAELSSTDSAHSTSVAQTHAAFIDFTAEIKTLNYFPLLLTYIQLLKSTVLFFSL